jgi:hypothetical protein
VRRSRVAAVKNGASITDAAPPLAKRPAKRTQAFMGAVAKTVAELTCAQDGPDRQQIIELLMKEIMKYDEEFRRENEAGSSARHVRKGLGDHCETY